MSEETATPAPNDAPTETAQEAAPTGDAPKPDDPRISKANQEAANYRKQLRTAEAELAKLRQASMTETEKAVAEAKQAGRSEALAAAAGRLAKAEFKAAAAGRIDNIDDLLEDLNLAKFVDADGEPDLKAIKARVDRWAPHRAPDFDGGARQTAGKTTDMNALIRQRAGLG
jgi:hypothetical protein